MTEADPLARACELVGRFLYRFARVESRLDEAITKLFKLDHETARIVATNIDFFKKRNIVLCAVKHQNSNAATPIEGMDTTFSAIANQNDARNIVAHSAFEPDPNDGVRFKRTVATTELQILDPHWTEENFKQHFTTLEALERDLEEVVRKLEPDRIKWFPPRSHPAFSGPDEGWLGTPQGSPAVLLEFGLGSPPTDPPAPQN
jgi:hypothetical protein